MKTLVLSQDMARAFATSLCLKEIRAYIDANKSDYEQYLAEEQQKKEIVTPKPRRRISRKGAN
ncbi:MAG: hypothetical protein LBC82_03985 [Oscillospiraceae bacterium]|jgi:hypothetical protein|nr:hypothetical protein [Oscillospiraceae bacterium]